MSGPGEKIADIEIPEWLDDKLKEGLGREMTVEKGLQIAVEEWVDAPDGLRPSDENLADIKSQFRRAPEAGIHFQLAPGSSYQEGISLRGGKVRGPATTTAVRLFLESLRRK
jgi:hypothetical protein